MIDRDATAARFRALLDEVRELDDLDLLLEMQQELITAARALKSTDQGSVGWHGMIGNCSQLVEMRRRIEKFAVVSSPVLILGASGTGKELVAKVLHDLSMRRKGPLVAENCAAIPDTLIESVLFGHVRGAFTGAVRDNPGHFVSAHKGTIFLDEIGEMPVMMQAKLLRVLQEGEVRPGGGDHPRKIDVRVIAATNREIDELVESGGFREDLYYRLNVLVLQLPPLCEREGDVALLMEQFVGEIEVQSGNKMAFSKEAIEALEGYSWPGNIRQLQNEVQRLGVLCAGREIALTDLSPAIARCTET